MLQPPYKYIIYKLRLAKRERDIFGNPFSCNELDVIAKALEDDLHQKEEFKFMHPNNSGTTYVCHYMKCPMNGNTTLLIGQMRKPLDFAMVRITLRSHYYKVPYIVFEDYTRAFRNPEMMVDMVKRAFNWALKKYGVEVMLEPWDTKKENIDWLADSQLSYIIELHKHPEIGAMCMGFEEALKERKQKIEADKAKKEKKGKKKNILKKSDNIMAYITHKNKEGIIAFLHQALRGMKTPKELARPVRLLCDRKILKDKDVYRLPYKAFIKEIPEAKDPISEKKYNHWLNPNSTNFDDDDIYKDLEKKLEMII